MFSEEVKQIELHYRDKRVSNLSKWKPPEYYSIIDATPFLPIEAGIKQRLWHIQHNKNSVPVCGYCDNTVKWIVTYKSYAEYCSIKCASASAKSKEKRRKTNLERYGVESFSQTDAHKNAIHNVPTEVWQRAKAKRTATVMEKYGVTSTNAIPGVVEKRQATNLERYGHTNVLASDYVKQLKTDKYGTSAYTTVPEFKEKRKNTMLERYGVEYSASNKELFDKRSNTCIERYGTAFFRNQHIPDEVKELLSSKEWLIDQHHNKQVTLTSIALNLNVDLGTVIHRFNLFDIEVRRYPASMGEREVGNFLLSHNIKVVTNDRNILDGKELDISIPSHNLAIEYCGLYWHSTAQPRIFPSYHKAKMQMCNDKGIRLITLFEDEWLHKQDIVKDKLLNVLNISNKSTVYARKCIIDIPTHQQKNEFFELNHIQGVGPGSIVYGLKSNDQYVAMMLFINTGGGTYTLNRYATSSNIPGGFSRLLKHFEKIHKPNQILSFADLRWSVGGVYERNGFTLDRTLPPDYYYVDLSTTTRIHKFNFRHKNLPNILGEKYDPNLSETENTESNGWHRIYNCGLRRYVKYC